MLQKSFWEGERKFLEPLMRFARVEVRGTISFRPKSIADLGSGVAKRRNSREVQRSTFARFLGRSIFDFCNNICQERKSAPFPRAQSRLGGRVAAIMSAVL